MLKDKKLHLEFILHYNINHITLKINSSITKQFKNDINFTSTKQQLKQY